MANSKSAEKRGRQTITRTNLNKAVKSQVKSRRKELAAAFEAGDKAAAVEAAKKVASAADRAAKIGVIHKNSASRLKSINATRIAALS